MMLPASTRSSPNFLTPRRRPSESRPLREEPPAFLWAMMNSVNLVLAGFAPERIPKISFRARLAGLGRLGASARSARLLLGRGPLRRPSVDPRRSGCGFARGRRSRRKRLSRSRRRRLSRGLRSRAAGEDLGDPDHGKVLAVAALALRVLAPPLLESDDLRASRLLHDLARDRDARDGRRAELRAAL